MKLFGTEYRFVRAAPGGILTEMLEAEMAEGAEKATGVKNLKEIVSHIEDVKASRVSAILMMEEDVYQALKVEARIDEKSEHERKIERAIKRFTQEINEQVNHIINTYEPDPEVEASRYDEDEDDGFERMMSMCTTKPMLERIVADLRLELTPGEFNALWSAGTDHFEHMLGSFPDMLGI